MIVSRAGELGRLDELLDSLRAGDGRALVLRGDPGIGKTTLLDALVEKCGDDATVLRARGVETEAELAFAALSDLVSPVLDGLGTLPAPQSAALAAALALGPPAPGDRLAVCVAALGVLRAAGARRPVLAVVDDIQWLDAASRECILYLARRAGGSVAVALAVRDPWDGFPRARLPDLQLRPLDTDASRSLLERTAPDLAPPVADAIADAAAGNPLALVELPATLTTDQRAGTTPLELPLDPGDRLQVAFCGRIEELEPAARRALLIAAAYDETDLRTIAAACDEAGTNVGLIAQADERGLARIDDNRLTFVHPLVRGAVYQYASAAERHRVHRALAAVLEGERRAWHRAAAALGPDEAVAAELEIVGAGAAARRGFASAATALERAARLSPDTEAMARRLHAAGLAAGQAGAPRRATALLEEAANATRDERLRARSEHMRGRLMIWNLSGAHAVQLLIREAERAVSHDPVGAAAILAEAAAGSTVTGAYEDAEVLAERAAALLAEDGGPAARGHVLAILGWTLLMRGKGARAATVLSEAQDLAAGFDPLGPTSAWQDVVLRTRIALGEYETALTASLVRCDQAREAGALGILASTLVNTADAALRLGRWDVAEEATREAIRVAGDTGQQMWHGYALTFDVRLSAARGEEAAGRRAALTALEMAEDEGMRTGQRRSRRGRRLLGLPGHAALGFLELSLDRIPAVIAELERVERFATGSGLEEPTIVPWAPDLIEAYVRAGRADDARRVLTMLERQAASSCTAFAAAAAARCRGLLVDDFDPAFGEALALDDRRPVPFERARTLLAFGRRLHRAGRRADARERLRDALRGFERLGAAAWAAQTQNELRAAGARRRSPRDTELTAQELRVAAAVQRGATNREIAAELFLTPKTIEFHLRKIYRKLGLRSRTQLVAAMARDPEADPLARDGPAALAPGAARARGPGPTG